MVVTHSGLTGLSVPCHVDRELGVALVHAPIPHQQTVDETVTDWDKLQSRNDVTHKVAQVKIFADQFNWAINHFLAIQFLGEVFAAFF